jgi:hypothetical protein
MDLTLLNLGFLVSREWRPYRAYAVLHLRTSTERRIDLLFDADTFIDRHFADGKRLTRSSYLDSAKRLALATGAATYGWEDLTKAPVSPSILINLRRRSQRSLDHIGFRKFGREVRLDG